MGFLLDTANFVSAYGRAAGGDGCGTIREVYLRLGRGYVWRYRTAGNGINLERLAGAKEERASRAPSRVGADLGSLEYHVHWQAAEFSGPPV